MIWLKGYFLKDLFLNMHAHLCLEQQNNLVTLGIPSAFTQNYNYDPGSCLLLNEDQPDNLQVIISNWGRKEGAQENFSFLYNPFETTSYF